MKKMIKGLGQLKKDWESAAKRKDYRFSIFSNKDFSESVFDKSGIDSFNILQEILKSWNMDISGKTVVDYGCGAGRVTRYIAQYAEEVFALDISCQMIKRLEERLNVPHNSYPNITVSVCSGKDLKPIETETIDIVYSLWVFQHTPENIVFKIVEDCRRVLKKGGLLIFQMALDKEHRAGICKPLPACSLAHWTRKEVKKMCKDTGFTGYNEYLFGSNDYFAFQK